MNYQLISRRTPLSLTLTVALTLLLVACIERREFQPPDEPSPPPTPSVPALQLPANNSYLGSSPRGTLRPAFQWQASQWDGTEVVRYTLEISADSSFSADITTVETTATSAQPPNELPISRTPPVGTRYFWRVKACAGTACSNFSQVWYINLGRVERDLNGDGYADIVLTAQGVNPVPSTAGRLYVYLGGAPFNTQADTVFNGDSSSNTWFRKVAAIGDFNGDGFADIAARVTQRDLRMPRVLLYFGGKGSILDSTPDHTLDVSDCAALGDWNGDGFDDLLVSSGSTSIQLGTKEQTLPAPEPYGAIRSARGAGDVNGDGFADFLSRGLNDEVLVYFGSAAPFDHEPDGRLTGTPSSQFGYSFSSAGDVNGDGLGDVLVGAPSDSTPGQDAGRAFVYLGKRGTSFDTAADGIFDGAVGEKLGFTVTPLGDLNGDGFDDFGIRTFISLRGLMYVYYGKAGSMVDTTNRTGLQGEQDQSSLFGVTSTGGDVNGDGFDDLWVGAPLYSTPVTYMVGRAYVFLGAIGVGLEPYPDSTLDQGEGDNAVFGYIALSSTEDTL